MCPNYQNGHTGKIPYWSNPNVMFQGVATGSDTENNAGWMTKSRFDSAALGTNCLDGNPDESGKMKNNCPNGEESYEPPLSDSLGSNFELNYIYHHLVWN